jgi:hypothetical protein
MEDLEEVLGVQRMAIGVQKILPPVNYDHKKTR